MLSAAARHGMRLLFTSTSEVYGKNSSGALNEEADRVLGSPFKSRWTYATSKTFGECLAHGFHREQGAANTVVRLFNTVGPRQTGLYGMVLPRFVRQALAGEALTVYGDGTQTRCFAHVHDTVRGILSLIETPDAIGERLQHRRRRRRSRSSSSPAASSSAPSRTPRSASSPTTRPTTRASRSSAAASRTRPRSAS